jgi:hypothetical protein
MEDNLEFGAMELGSAFCEEAQSLVANENRPRRGGGSGCALSVHEGGLVDSNTAAREMVGGGRATLALAAKLRRAAWSVGPKEHRVLSVAATRLESCVAKNRRCCFGVCPRCNGRLARRYRSHLERDIRKLSGKRFACLTLTMPVDAPVKGHSSLTRSFAALRRRVCWKRSFEGGEQHVQLEPSQQGTTRGWNLHTHALLVVRHGGSSEEGALRAAWAELLGVKGAVGRLYLDRSPDLTQRGADFSPVSYYISRRAYSKWVDDDPQVLAARVRFHTSGLKLTTRFGCLFGNGSRQHSPKGGRSV